jgi:hypothetical protein
MLHLLTSHHQFLPGAGAQLALRIGCSRIQASSLDSQQHCRYHHHTHHHDHDHRHHHHQLPSPKAVDARCGCRGAAFTNICKN